MEKSEVSIHELRVYRVLQTRPDAWLSNHEIAQLVEGVAHRTVRLHTKRLVDLGIFDVADVFPGHRYRWAQKATNRNKGYVARLEAAGEVFGV